MEGGTRKPPSVSCPSVTGKRQRGKATEPRGRLVGGKAVALRWRPRPAEAAAPWFTGTPSGAALRQSPCHGDAGGEPAPRKGQTEIAVRLGDASRPAGHLTGPHASTLTRCLKVSRSDTEIHGKGQAITEQHPQRRPAARTHGEPQNLSGKGPADSEPHHPSNEKQRKHNEARRRQAGVGAPQGHRAPRQPSRHPQPTLLQP